MPAFCNRKTSHSYFVVMCDYSDRGLEAVVHPEDTRRDIVAKIASGEFENIAFIHHVDGLFIEDVTSDLTDEAWSQHVAELRSAMDREAFWDRVRDERRQAAE